MRGVPYELPRHAPFRDMPTAALGPQKATHVPVSVARVPLQLITHERSRQAARGSAVGQPGVSECAEAGSSRCCVVSWI
eukprot:363984-Chlamydomonas_euryale.AAC.5